MKYFLGLQLFYLLLNELSGFILKPMGSISQIIAFALGVFITWARVWPSWVVLPMDFSPMPCYI